MFKGVIVPLQIILPMKPQSWTKGSLYKMEATLNIGGYHRNISMEGIRNYILLQQTHKVGLDTYVHIYVEVDLSRWLPDKMILKWETYKWA